MNINQSWLKEGYATFTYPANLSPESAEWLLEWLELTQRQIKRHMEQDIAAAENQQLIFPMQEMSEEDETFMKNLTAANKHYEKQQDNESS